MKLLSTFLLLTTTLVAHAEVLSRQHAVVEAGPHTRTYRTVSQVRQPDGSVTERRGGYVELASGLNRWDAQAKQWVPADAKIVPSPDGRHGLALNLQCPGRLAANLADPIAFDFQLLDGQRLAGRILGLAYTDGKNQVLVAEPKDCVGVIGGAEQSEVAYIDAFTDVGIDVVMVLEKGRISQNLVIRERLPDPASLGMGGDTVVLLLTEMVVAPQVTVEARAGAAPLLPEHRVRFGSMELAPGRAFSIGAEVGEEAAPVRHAWEVIDNRHFIVERIPWSEIQAQVQKLPPPAADAAQRTQERVRRQAQLPDKNGWLPARRAARADDPTMRIRTAQAGERGSARGPRVASGGPPEARASDSITGVPKSQINEVFGGSPKTAGQRPALPNAASFTSALADGRPGYVIDWEAVQTIGFFTNKADTTYYVTGAVSIVTNYAEGSSVIKFAPTNNAKIIITGQMICQGNFYKPTILTARDDTSVGEDLSIAALSGYAAPVALSIQSSISTDLRHLCIRHAATAISYDDGAAVHQTNTHLQIVNCGQGLVANAGGGYTVHAYSRNVLLSNVKTNFSSTHRFTNRCEHLTSADFLRTTDGASVGLLLTNSLLTGTGTMTYDTANSASVGTSTTTASTFSPVGAAYYYLAAGSLHRNAGVATINPELASAIKRLSTYPPIVLGGTLTTPLTLAPQAQRDTDTPDRGAHYAPLDYVVNVLLVTNTTLLLTNGVCVGWYGGNGIWLRGASQLISEGSPVQRVHLSRYTTVMEQPTNWINTTYNSVVSTDHGSGGTPAIRLRFTDLDAMASDGTQLYVNNAGSEFTTLSLRDCEIGSGMLRFGGPTTAVQALTNNLFRRVQVDWFEQGTMNAFNNTFYGGGVTFAPGVGAATWTFKDNLFDRVLLNGAGSVAVNSHNGYFNTTALTGGSNNKTLTSLTYDKGPLGDYYLSTVGGAGTQTDLFNTGSRNATNATLYHFTTTTNQTKEATTVVDMGYHYVAVTNISGVWLPVDTDADGVSDVQEDKNGNGALDPSETRLDLTDTDGDGVSDYWEWLVGRSGTVSGAVPDSSGLANLRVLTPTK